jgi:hypothetical protein
MARKNAFERAAETKAQIDALKQKLEQQKEEAARDIMKLFVRSGLADLNH